MDSFPKDMSRTDGKYPWCKSCVSTKQKNRYDQELSWKRMLKNRYNISAEEYYTLLDEQGGGCAFCGRTIEEEGKRLAVDHDHSCCPGRKSCGMCVRGLLCDYHNKLLGVYESNPSFFDEGAKLYISGCM